jgi:DNA recombination protein RmuC
MAINFSELSQVEILLLSMSAAVIFLLLILLVWFNRKFDKQETMTSDQVKSAQIMQESFQQTRTAMLESLLDTQGKIQSNMEQRFGEVQQSLEKRLGEMSQVSTGRFGEMQNSIEKRLGEMSKESIQSFAKSNNELHELLQKRLNDISGQVETRLNKGFEKTTETFTDVIKRLALIDEAQKKITELSGNVVSLQEVLTDKRSRGAFGEVQMAGLIRNVMPENSYALQHSLSNGTRVDCMMFLPEPTGNIALDSKFPLDSFQKMMDDEASDAERLAAEKQFRLDIKKHIKDIADKYIIENETADGAIMFIPAEAVFAEIHAHQPQLVEEAQRARVWLVSPTTLMAVLTTARAVLKDSATRKQVHVIQDHLVYLAKDFDRFKKRMDNLSRHIQQANRDVEDVHKSATKISSRFEKIEKVEIEQEDVDLLESDNIETKEASPELLEAD